jgi:O-antigen/teichoic acid export membrane protein
MKSRWLSLLQRGFGSPDAIRLLVHGASIAFVIQIAGSGIGYVGQILLARWMGLDEYGTFTYLVSWIRVFISGALMGMNLGVVRFISEYLMQQDRQRLRGILRWSRGLVLIAGILLAAGSGWALFFVRPVDASAVSILLASLAIPLWALTEIQMQIIRSAKRIAWAYGPPLILQPVLLVLLAYIFLRVLGQLTDYLSIGALLISICLVGILQGGMIGKAFSAFLRNAPAVYDVPTWLRVSFPILLNSMFTILILNVDTLAVGYFLGSEEVGLYGAAIKTATVIGMPMIATNTVIAPMIASYHAARDTKGLQNAVSLATLASFGFSLAVGLGILFLSGPLLDAFGAGFSLAQAPLVVLILGQWFGAGSGTVGLLMILTGYERQSLAVLGWCTLIESALCVIVIPVFGILGAAVVSTLGLCLWNIWMHHLVVRHLGIHPSIFFAVRKILSVRE